MRIETPNKEERIELYNAIQSNTTNAKTQTNLLVINAKTILENGLNCSGNEPFLNTSLCEEASNNLLAKLPNIADFDFKDLKNREKYEKEINRTKQIFNDYEKNIKVIKKAYSGLPKQIDAVSKIVRDISEPAILTARKPLKELEEQELFLQKMWKNEGIPTNLNDLKNYETEIENKMPLQNSTVQELNQFGEYKKTYLAEIRRRIKAEELFLEAEKKAAEEKKQAEIEAKAKELLEKQKQAEESLKLSAEAQKTAEIKSEIKPSEPQNNFAQANTQLEQNIGSNMPQNAKIPENYLSDGQILQRKIMRRETLDSLTPICGADIAEKICRLIFEEKIPNVRFFYE